MKPRFNCENLPKVLFNLFFVNPAYDIFNAKQLNMRQKFNFRNRS